MKHIKLYEDMSYTDFFGKKVSHEDALRSDLVGLLTDIITEEEKISEKSFVQYEWAMNIAREINDSDSTMEKSQAFYKDGRRLNLLAELLYEEYKRDNPDNHKPEPGSKQWDIYQKRLDDMRKKFGK